MVVQEICSKCSMYVIAKKPENYLDKFILNYARNNSSSK